MKYYRYIISLIGILSIFSCAHTEKWNDIHTVKVEAEAIAPKKATTTEIGDTITTPPYDITVDMEFMDTTSIENREACNKINTYLIEEFLNQKGELDCNKAVDAFIENLKAQYAQDDISRQIFDHYTGKAVYGKEGVINYILVENYYSGGAHPTSVTSILRFDTNTGEKIDLNGFFNDTCQYVLCDRLINRLMADKGVPTIDSLHAIGYLEVGDMFVSENFILNKDSISFFYNQYDIAPYACGTTTISFSYEELKDYIRK